MLADEVGAAAALRAKRLEDEELDDADALWLYEKVKTLHNSDLNARIMTEVSHRTLPPCAAATCSRLQPRQVRNQFFILLSVLLGQGRRMADVCIHPMHKHSHKPVLIDYSSGASGLPRAVDAATMLENFHSYAMALYRIGAAEAAGSQRQRAAFRPAQWLFDMGDGARL